MDALVRNRLNVLVTDVGYEYYVFIPDLGFRQVALRVAAMRGGTPVD
ncbi:hypothetical protein Acaty_m0176 (plasmid) [Acidithiobacillus caldus ATCC 51756]|uniref:Uncharacterized protein n=1 Tax=Acidithiobacillus caldus (strain ATCC 51756 / DSM 8584 / KU) TaxID=637389 RepID=A0A059ZVK7_ACICK|nr:hypothetical protein Acaty_m0176 [Acidithiobacillus caldus ATCC 51756]